MNSGDRTREETEGGSAMGAVQGNKGGESGAQCAKLKRDGSSTRLCHRKERETWWNTPSKGCSKKGRVDKYGDTYGTIREFNRKVESFEDNTICLY